MPILAGLQLYKMISDTNKKVKVCLFSAVQPDFEKYRKVCASFDEKYFIKKPIPLGDLAKRIKSV
jgi:YesN/AraC family two-component response regulator